MAEQHHELAHVFTEASQGVNDARGGAPRTLNTPYTFPGYTNAEWTEKAAALRQQIRGANGLVPTHEPTPLNAEIFGKSSVKITASKKSILNPSPASSQQEPVPSAWETRTLPWDSESTWTLGAREA